jgi:cell division protein FtsQ
MRAASGTIRTGGTASRAGAAEDPGDPEAALPDTPVRRRANRWKVMFISLLVIGVFGVAAWVLLGSRLLVVRHVEVVGTHLLPRDRVVGVARIHLGTPMIRLGAGAVRDRIEGIQEVEAVRVERSWPTTIRIVVTERVPVVVVPRGGRFQQYDRYGVLVVTTPARPPALPDLVVATPGPADAATWAALTAWRSLPPRLVRRLVAVEAPTTESITFRLSGGRTIVWGAAERAAEKLRLIDALSRTPAGRSARTIDVSSPEVVTTG